MSSVRKEKRWTVFQEGWSACSNRKKCTAVCPWANANQRYEVQNSADSSQVAIALLKPAVPAAMVNMIAELQGLNPTDSARRSLQCSITALSKPMRTARDNETNRVFFITNDERLVPFDDTK